MSASVSLCIHANTLKICFYDGNRYYKAVTKYLVGKFSIPQWDKKKSKIKPSVPHSAENNEILFNLLSKYNNVIAVNKNITAKELSCFFDKKMSRPPVSIDELIQRDVEMESKKTGSNYKNYEQLRRYLLT
jgi:hypothetical protein